MLLIVCVCVTAGITVQIQLAAFDSAFPENQSLATVSVFVVRNTTGPTFIPGSVYHTTVSEGLAAGSLIMQLSAVDNIHDVCTC